MIKIKSIDWPLFAKHLLASWFIAECLSIVIGLIYLTGVSSPHGVTYLRDLVDGAGGARQLFVAVIGTIVIASTVCSLILVPLIGLPLIGFLISSKLDGLISFVMCSVVASVVIGSALFYVTSSMMIDDRMLILALTANFCITIMISFWMMYRPDKRRII